MIYKQIADFFVYWAHTLHEVLRGFTRWSQYVVDRRNWRYLSKWPMSDPNDPGAYVGKYQTRIAVIIIIRMIGWRTRNNLFLRWLSTRISNLEVSTRCSPYIKHSRDMSSHSFQRDTESDSDWLEFVAFHLAESTNRRSCEVQYLFRIIGGMPDPVEGHGQRELIALHM